jgi:hypothetical protein
MKLICVALQAIVPEGFISGTGVAQYLRQRVSPCDLQGDTWGLPQEINEMLTQMEPSTASSSPTQVALEQVTDVDMAKI